MHPNVPVIKIILILVISSSFLFIYPYLNNSLNYSKVSALETYGGLEAYWDYECTQRVTSIDWGILQPGSNRDLTLFIQNEGDNKIHLELLTENWSPSIASENLNLEWDYTGESIKSGEKKQIMLTLTIPLIIYIEDFSFDILIIAEEVHDINAGWNMIGSIYDQTVSADDLFPSFYQLVTWDGSSYVSSTVAEVGVGYWVLVLGETTVSFENADPITSYTKSLPAGWSMIGSIPDETVNADDVFPGFYQLLTWDGSSYVTATTIEPGKGYWALVLEPTTITVGG
jgi:hypothetical protein